jgi:hypothetical protein
VEVTLRSLCLFVKLVFERSSDVFSRHVWLMFVPHSASCELQMVIISVQEVTQAAHFTILHFYSSVALHFSHLYVITLTLHVKSKGRSLR